MKNKYQQGGDNELMELFNQFAQSSNGEFKSGDEVYQEYNKLSPEQQQQFIQSIKGQDNAQSEELEDNSGSLNQNVQDTTLMQVGGKNPYNVNAVTKFGDKRITKNTTPLTMLQDSLDTPGTKANREHLFFDKQYAGYDDKDRLYVNQQIDNNKKYLGEHRPVDIEKLSEMTKKYGDSKVKFSGHFTPSKRSGYLIKDNTIQIDTAYANTGEEVKRNILAEMSHEKSYRKDKPFGSKDRAISDRIDRSLNTRTSDEYDAKQYDTPGTEEYYAHKIVQPELEKEYNQGNTDGIYSQKMYDDAKFLKPRGKFQIPLSVENQSGWSGANRTVNEIKNSGNLTDEDLKLYQTLRKKQTGGIPTNKNGYYELDPNEDPIAKIPSGRLTMKNIPYEIQAIGGSGKDYGMMQPDEEYNFPDEDYMYEIPKAQVGNRSPRHNETEKEKRARILKYNPKGGKLNYDYSLMRDADMLRSAEANVPFVKGQAANPVIVNSKGKAITKSKGKSTSTSTKPYVADAVDEYYMRDANRLPDNIKPLVGKGTKDIETGLQDIPSLDRYIPQTAKDNGFIKGKSITMDFDNPAEARAIAYKRFKNGQSLSPYKGNVNLESPSLYQESAEPYLNNIREQRNSALQNVNPNTATGQAVLSNLYGQSLNQENNMLGQVAKSNAQNTTNWMNQRSQINNQQQQIDNSLNDKYYGDVAQIEATKNENDINYMDQISQMNAKRLQAKNRFLGTAIETGLGDALDIGENSVTFDVGKIPYKTYGASQPNTDIPRADKLNLKMINGVPYHMYFDADGNPQGRPVNINKKQYGGMGRYNMKISAK